MNSKRVIGLIFLLMLLAGTVEAQVYEAREWVALNGSKQFARFKSLDNDTVVLEKNNRKTLRIKLSQLSQVDQKYIGSLGELQTDARINKYKRFENRLIYASDIASFYNDELNKELSPEIKTWIQTRMQALSKPVADKSLWIENQFLTPEEFDTIKRASNRNIDQWCDLVKAAGNDTSSPHFSEAQNKITQARRNDPYSFRADYALGVVNVFATRDFEQAERHFQVCVKRGRQYLSILSDVEKENFASALNNLALLAVRSDKLTLAHTLWEEAMAVDPTIENDVAANVARVIRFMKANTNDRIYMRSTNDLKKTYVRWQTALPDIKDQKAWIYRPYMIEMTEDELAAAKEAVDAENAEDGVNEEPAGTGTPEARIAEGHWNVFGGNDGESPRRAEMLGTNMRDTACLSCSGSGFLPCFNGACRRGKVTKSDSKIIKNKRGDTVNAMPYKYQVTCPTCRGADRTKCWGCGADGVQR